MGFAELVLASSRPAVRQPASLEQRAEWGTSAIPGPMATAGTGSFAHVNLGRLESNFQQVAVWSAIDLIASVSSQLPLDTYRKQPDGTNKNIGNPKPIDDPDGSGQGAQDWIYQYLVSKLGRGNAVGKQIIDPMTGFPSQTILYHPDDVKGWRDRETGQPRWKVDNKEVPASEIWHRRSYPMPGCLMGTSPLGVHMTTVGLGVASTRFGSQFFSDAAIPSALLQNSEIEIDQTVANEVKARWMGAIYGTREPAVFGKGWDYKQISLAPEESQFLDTNKYTQAQCCRIYGPNIAEILGYETGGSMTYQNVEQRAIDFLKFTLNRWLRDLETTMSLWLPRGQFVKVNRNALLETDLLSRFKAYGAGIAGHFLVPSEARTYEDLPPLTEAQKAELDALPAPVINPLKESPK